MNISKTVGNYWTNYFTSGKSTAKSHSPYKNSLEKSRSMMHRSTSHHKLNSDLNHDLTTSYPYIPSNTPNSPVLFIGFNCDQNCFFCSTETGFFVYNSDPFMERFRREFDGGIGIIELLGRSNILALVGGGNQPEYSPNKVIIWDDYQSKVITELEYTTEVLSVKCRESRVMVSLYHKTYIYNFSDLRLQHQYETYPNPKGICDLSLDGNVLVVLGNRAGDVRVEHLNTKKSHIIHAHQSDISQLCLSQDGSLLATASKKGTLVRIWDTMSGDMIKELRRGIDPVNILSLTFNSNNTTLCVSSDKGTIHIYSLMARKELAQHEKNKKSTLSFMSGFLPTYFSSEWSYFSFQVPHFHNGKCAFSSEDPNTIIVLTHEGRYYKYRIDAEREHAQLMQTHSILQ